MLLKLFFVIVLGFLLFSPVHASASNRLVLLYGDSLTQGGKWSQHFINLDIQNLGVGGYNSSDVLKAIEEQRFDPNSVTKIFLQVGINDLGARLPIKNIFDNHLEAWKLLKEKYPNAKLFIISLLPVNENCCSGRVTNASIQNINKKLKEMASQQSITFIDLHQDMVDDNGVLKENFTRDGLHLTKEGYDIWYKVLEPYLN